MVSQSCYNQELMTGCCNSFGFGFITLNPMRALKLNQRAISLGKGLLVQIAKQLNDPLDRLFTP